jgi:PIN domain nuclease of toxin-antitoxin system
VIYLDTHVVVWLYVPRKDLLSDNARRRIDEDDLYVSPMVLLEIEFLREIGRLSVGGNAIYEELHRKIGLKICELDFLAAVRSALGLAWTRDPFDRVIVGHALAASRDLLTRDEVIRANYPRASW